MVGDLRGQLKNKLERVEGDVSGPGFGEFGAAAMKGAD
jgi:hypothetical protein